jgi:cell division protein FtsZ
MISFELAESQPASIKVIGVGGGGGNAVNHMFAQGIKDVDFILCNTDSQALQKSPVPIKIHLGNDLTKGRGAGNKPAVGREAAIETIEEVEKVLQGTTQMVFVTAGMGGGTGTGAAPIIAQAAKQLGILTVGIVTIPFRFEGRKRVEQALEGVRELSEHVDSLLVINNEKLREMHGNLSLSEAFAKADNVLAIAAKGIAEIITVHGMVNVDFADVQYVMADSGVALMGSATASGPDRARAAIEAALDSPLLNNADIRGAKDILLNISSGSEEVTMDEISEVTDFIISQAGDEVNMIWGSVKDESLGDNISVTIIATGFEMESIPEFSNGLSPKAQKIELCDSPQAKIKGPGKTETQNAEISVIEAQAAPARSKEIEIERVSIDDEAPAPAGKPEANKQPLADLEYTVKQGVLPFGQEQARQPRMPQPVRDSSLLQRKPAQEPPLPKFSRDGNEFRYEHIKQMEDISQYENIPAIQRKKMQQAGGDISGPAADAGKEVSKFSLSEDERGAPRLKDTNSFFTDLVD